MLQNLKQQIVINRGKVTKIKFTHIMEYYAISTKNEGHLLMLIQQDLWGVMQSEKRYKIMDLL